MSNRFVISDTHFGHEACCTKFTRADGSPLRPFSCAEEMDEAMVDRWNAVVGPKDKVYHLGDVVIARRNLATVSRLNRRKVLVKGNHDIFKLKDFVNAGFEDILGVSVHVDKFILSHIPQHPESITKRFKVNVHGHTHANRVMKILGAYTSGELIMSKTEIDPRYLCVSVEHTDYRPLSFEEVEIRIEQQKMGVIWNS